MKKDLSKTQIKEVLIVSILIFAASIISIFAGYLYNGESIEAPEERRSSESLDSFVREYNRILDNYYIEVDEDVLIKGAIKGMLDALEDEYTSFLDESENYRFQQRVQGYYDGIGIGLYDDEDGNMVISTIFPDTPAERAGVLAGDIIIELDGEDFTEKESGDLVEYIRWLEEDNISMTVMRDGKEIIFEIEKRTVILPSVDSEIIEKDGKKIGFISISIFASNTPTQFSEHLEKLEGEVDAFIIDVRYNSGGYLTSAERMLSMFLDKSKIIYQTEEKGDIETFYSNGTETKDIPVVMLGNKSSASASEIMIAAMMESYGSPFVGKATYGKGTVQEKIELEGNESLKYTARKWLTPSGNWIEKVGVEPDFDIDQNVDFFISLEQEDDAQLQKALEVSLELLK